jgi:hypothetical protein
MDITKETWNRLWELAREGLVEVHENDGRSITVDLFGTPADASAVIQRSEEPITLGGRKLKRRHVVLWMDDKTEDQKKRFREKWEEAHKNAPREIKVLSEGHVIEPILPSGEVLRHHFKADFRTHTLMCGWVRDNMSPDTCLIEILDADGSVTSVNLNSDDEAMAYLRKHGLPQQCALNGWTIESKAAERQAPWERV